MCVIHIIISCYFLSIYSAKPSMNTFLKAFVNELNEILCDGLAIGNKKVSFKIRCFICDTPARAAIRGMYKYIYT